MAQWKAQGNLNGRSVTQKIVLSAQTEYTAKEIKGGNGIVLCQLDYSSVRLWVSGNNDFSTATELSITLRGKKWNFTDSAGNPMLYETFYIWTRGISDIDIILEVSSDSDGIDYYLGNSSVNESVVTQYGSRAVAQLRDIMDIPNPNNPIKLNGDIEIGRVNISVLGMAAYLPILRELAELEQRQNAYLAEIIEAFNTMKAETPNPNNYPFFVVVPSYRESYMDGDYNTRMSKCRVNSEAQVSFELWNNSYLSNIRFSGGNIIGTQWQKMQFTNVTAPTGYMTVSNTNIDLTVYSGELSNSSGRNWSFATSGDAVKRAGYGNPWWARTIAPHSGTSIVGSYEDYFGVWVPNLGDVDFAELNLYNFKYEGYQAWYKFIVKFRSTPNQYQLAQQIAAKRAELNNVVGTSSRFELLQKNYDYATILNFNLSGLNLLKLPIADTNDSIGAFICYVTVLLENPTDIIKILEFSFKTNMCVDGTDTIINNASIEFLNIEDLDMVNARLDSLNQKLEDYNTDDIKNTSILYSKSNTYYSKLIGGWDKLGDLISSLTSNGGIENSVVKTIGANSGLGILLSFNVFTRNTITSASLPAAINLRECLEIHLIGEK